MVESSPYKNKFSHLQTEIRITPLQRTTWLGFKNKKSVWKHFTGLKLSQKTNNMFGCLSPLFIIYNSSNSAKLFKFSSSDRIQQGIFIP